MAADGATGGAVGGAAGGAELEPPEPLIRDIESGQAILFLGAGASRQAGYPSWGGLLDECREILDNQGASASHRRAFDRLVEAGQLIDAAEVLAGCGPSADEELIRYVRQRFSERRPPPRLHQILMRLPFYSFFTTNYDDLIGQTWAELFADLELRQFSYASTDIVEALSSRPYVLHLHGSHHGARPILTRTDYTGMLYGNERLGLFLRATLAEHPMVFVGYSLGDEDLIRPLEYIRYVLGNGSRIHYIVLRDDEDASQWDRERLERRYGLRPVFFRDLDPRRPFSGLLPFVEQLADRVVCKRGHPPRPVPAELPEEWLTGVVADIERHLAHPPRRHLQGVVLFGSRARVTRSEQPCDLDVLLLLSTEHESDAEFLAGIEAPADEPVDIETMDASRAIMRLSVGDPFMVSVCEDGIELHGESHLFASLRSTYAAIRDFGRQQVKTWLHGMVYQPLADIHTWLDADRDALRDGASARPRLVTFFSALHYLLQLRLLEVYPGARVPRGLLYRFAKLRWLLDQAASRRIVDSAETGDILALKRALRDPAWVPREVARATAACLRIADRLARETRTIT